MGSVAYHIFHFRHGEFVGLGNLRLSEQLRTSHNEVDLGSQYSLAADDPVYYDLVSSFVSESLHRHPTDNADNSYRPGANVRLSIFQWRRLSEGGVICLQV